MKYESIALYVCILSMPLTVIDNNLDHKIGCLDDAVEKITKITKLHVKYM